MCLLGCCSVRVYLINMFHKIFYDRTSSNTSWPDNHSIRDWGNLSSFGFSRYIFLIHFGHHGAKFNSMPFLLNFSSANIMIILLNLWKKLFMNHYTIFLWKHETWNIDHDMEVSRSKKFHMVRMWSATSRNVIHDRTVLYKLRRTEYCKK